MAFYDIIKEWIGKFAQGNVLHSGLGVLPVQSLGLVEL